jgi:transglutaminase-like putative cysteine protease
VTAAPAPSRLSASLAAAILAGAGLLAWSQALGDGVLRALPVAALAVLLVARRIPARAAAPLVLAWFVVAPLLASLTLSIYAPAQFAPNSRLVAVAAHQLSTAGALDHGAGGWPLALALAASGLSWLIGGALAADRGPLRVAAFVLLAAPMGAANLLQSDVAWQGAVLVAAGLLWLSPRRAALATSGAIAVAILALAVTDTIRPQGRWLVASASASSDSGFSSLDTEQTYGPLAGTRKGRTMLDVTAGAPALWRAQVLERFNGRQWRLGATTSALPEPAAQETTTTVRVRALKDDLIVAPGRIEAVSTAQGRAHSWLGGSWVISPTPSTGQTYKVRSAVVHATEGQLADIPFPTDTSVLAFTNTGYGETRSDAKWTAVEALARRLTAGAATPLEAVKRVQAYLLNSGTFTYTTDVGAASSDPILDFLLKTHRGYCQHFAGAAALLLRMAGVPTRVVVGFATGQSDGKGTYAVRDEDAHAWIEVYFEGVGWVAFNPTPGGAAATVAAAATALPAATAAAASGDTSPAAIAGGGAVVLVALAGGGFALRRRQVRRRRRAGDGATTGTAARTDPLTAGLERIAGPLPPAHTLAQLRGDLAVRVGPRTAALAGAVERARYAPSPAASTEVPHRPRRALWHALREDVGTRRALRLLVLRS